MIDNSDNLWNDKGEDQGAAGEKRNGEGDSTEGGNADDADTCSSKF